MGPNLRIAAHRCRDQGWDFASRPVLQDNLMSARRFAKVGSYYPHGKNFRLTGDLQATFTEKLRLVEEFCG
jgi:hypothetical protein